jgi:hypothetical protein
MVKVDESVYDTLRSWIDMGEAGRERWRRVITARHTWALLQEWDGHILNAVPYFDPALAGGRIVEKVVLALPQISIWNWRRKNNYDDPHRWLITTWRLSCPLAFKPITVFSNNLTLLDIRDDNNRDFVQAAVNEFQKDVKNRIDLSLDHKFLPEYKELYEYRGSKYMNAGEPLPYRSDFPIACITNAAISRAIRVIENIRKEEDPDYLKQECLNSFFKFAPHNFPDEGRLPF